MTDLHFPAQVKESPAAQQNFDEILKKWTARSAITTLPTDPFDGQEINFLADSAGTYGGPFLWHCMYIASIAGTSKWYVMSSAPLRASIATRQSVVTGAIWTDLPTVGPSITVPIVGIYDARWSMKGELSNTGCSLQAGLAVGATAPPNPNAQLATPTTITGWAGTLVDMVSCEDRRSFATNDDARVRYFVANPTNVVAGDRVLTLQPLRIG